jgi:hypothetical protein
MTLPTRRARGAGKAFAAAFPHAGKGAASISKPLYINWKIAAGVHCDLELTDELAIVCRNNTISKTGNTKGGRP